MIPRNTNDKGCIVVITVLDKVNLELTYGPWCPVGLAYRLWGFSRSYLYRLLDEGKLTKVVVRGSVCVLDRELNDLRKGKDNAQGHT